MLHTASFYKRKCFNAIKNKECVYELASKTYSVPKTTLVRRVKDKNKLIMGSKKGMLQNSILPSALEESLVSHILRIESLFGLTYCDVRKISFELAKRKCIKHNLNQATRMAG